jgi:hypothetical protein
MTAATSNAVSGFDRFIICCPLFPVDPNGRFGCYNASEMCIKIQITVLPFIV